MPPDRRPMTEEEFEEGLNRYLESVAHECHCCNRCSPVVCAGVAAGGFCDRSCWCSDADEPRFEEFADE